MLAFPPPKELGRRAPLVLAVALVVTQAVALSSCASDDEAPPGPKAGSGALDASSPSGDVEQSGRIVIARSEDQPLEGATVAVGDRTTTTKADGTYELAVPRGAPYTTTVTALDHYKHIEQEWIADKDVKRVDTNLLPKPLAALLEAFLPGRDRAKGVLVVRVAPVRGCDDEGGATLTLEPAGAAKLRYFAGGLPSSTTQSVTKGESLSAAFYDVEVGVPLRVTVASPVCTPLGFPIAEDDVTYTGNVRAEAGEALSYVRVFLGAKTSDAGAD